MTKAPIPVAVPKGAACQEASPHFGSAGIILCGRIATAVMKNPKSKYAFAMCESCARKAHRSGSKMVMKGDIYTIATTKQAQAIPGDVRGKIAINTPAADDMEEDEGATPKQIARIHELARLQVKLGRELDKREKAAAEQKKLLQANMT